MSIDILSPALGKDLMHMTPRARWLIAASSTLSALLALALTGGSLDGGLGGLAWYYGLMFPWATLGTLVTMLALIVVPATDPIVPVVGALVIIIAGAIQGAIAAAVVLAGRTWCVRRRSLPAV
ncbi:MAG: hypothetical protein K0S49_398 [Microbacterium sp.]|jgi:hypothetical protein|nr:hypothetical protein [Microbacterium sp.]